MQACTRLETSRQRMKGSFFVTDDRNIFGRYRNLDHAFNIHIFFSLASVSRMLFFLKKNEIKSQTAKKKLMLAGFF